MRNFLLLLGIVIMSFPMPGSAQSNQAPHPNAQARNVYAVVVGISHYANNGIPELSFAHRDAQVFADFLRSPSGGQVPEDHIRVLLNAQATYAAIYDAIIWLTETAKENDLVYFYFSGHGDMENSTIYKMGFLLSYDTPKSNYINNAVSIDYLNAFANTLSVRSKANVVLITDACHSGKLSGSDNRGNFLVGEQLKKVKSQEVRISSCAPNELSVEDEGWGGGRGVFSYYLINGLQGLADEQPDGVVTVHEIDKYLHTTLSSDVLLARKDHKQTPNVTGNQSMSLATVDATRRPLLLSAPIVGSAAPVGQALLKPLAKPAQALFFETLDSLYIEELFDFNALQQLPVDDIPFAFLTQLPLSVGISPDQVNAITEELHRSPDALKRFKNKLVVMMSDRGQEVINAYLEGDEAELERRRYYNSRNNGYDKYPVMYAVALKLARPGSDLARILQLKQYYFTGVAARLKIPLVKDPRELIRQALEAQLKAYAMEENAAYIQNELGVLYYAKNDLSKAEKFFSRATQIAPKWPIPLSNLADIYLSRKEQDKALAAIDHAIDLQPHFQGSYINKGLLYEQKNNLLFAEEFYRKSIQLNSRHYLPFERLAYVYNSTTDYALADSFFYEADKRKKGFYFNNPRKMLLPMPLSDVLSMLQICDFDYADVARNPVPGNFTWGMKALSKGDTITAEEKFRETIALDHSNPLAYHYLGKLLYAQKRWKEADAMLTQALAYWLEPAAFDLHSKALFNRMKPSASNPCFQSVYKNSHYDQVNDHYLLGDLSEQWGHYTAAEKHYRQIIQMHPEFIGGYQKLWTMMEATGRYHDAENVIRLLVTQDPRLGNNALNAFYKRMIARFPDDKMVYYQAGSFLYDLAAANPSRFLYDQKEILPDSEEPSFVRPYTPTDHFPPVRLPDTGEELALAPTIFHPLSDAIQDLQLADSLYEDDETLAEINQKIGDLLVWQGIGEKSIPNYRKSVALQPGNANTRMKLVEATSHAYQLSEALAQLDSLNNRGQLNLPMQLRFAKYCMHAARFKEANEAINQAKAVYPYPLPEILELGGRLKTLEKDPAMAVAYYTQLTSLRQDAATSYSIARSYARLNQAGPAVQWLQRSIAEGFNYSWVIKEDDSWKNYRHRNDWKMAVRRLVPKEYSEGE